MQYRREFHMVWGNPPGQGWQETATGWHMVDTYDSDQWARDSYRVIEWPSYIPQPIRPGLPPRQRY